jgi:hypothetical protein
MAALNKARAVRKTPEVSALTLMTLTLIKIIIITLAFIIGLLFLGRFLF